MREKGSLFKKYFSIYAVTLLICIFMLGVALLYFASQYFRDANKSSLAVAADKAIEATELNFERNDGELIRSELEQEYALIYRTTGTMVFLSDYDGRIEICSEGDACVHQSLSIPQMVREVLLTKGEYFETGYLGGFFDSEGRYTYGKPIVIDDVLYGYLFASTSLSELFQFLYQVMLMFLFSSLAAFALSFIIIYYSTRILTRPLHDISQAAERFAVGDFGVRVEVSGSDEIGSLAKVINNMAESLSELEMTRRNFVANVSHELRTPMTTIAGYIDGILDGTIPKEDQAHYLQIVTDEVKRLSRLTSSLLNIARMEAGEENATIISHNAWDIVLNVMWNMEQRITEKEIIIKEMEVEPRFVYCDADMLHQVIYNLLDNAVKFTPQGGTISVSIHPDQEMTDIVIRNSGAGIDEEHINRIFERFYKSDRSRSLDKQGTGLGLYIVKTLLARMDGTISASSIKGEYTEFTVKLKTGPARRQRAKSKKDVEISKQSEKEKKSFIERMTRGFRKEDKR